MDFRKESGTKIVGLEGDVRAGVDASHRRDEEGRVWKPHRAVHTVVQGA